jgi:hypothetical protein
MTILLPIMLIIVSGQVLLLAKQLLSVAKVVAGIRDELRKMNQRQEGNK